MTDYLAELDTTPPNEQFGLLRRWIDASVADTAAAFPATGPRAGKETRLSGAGL